MKKLIKNTPKNLVFFLETRAAGKTTPCPEWLNSLNTSCKGWDYLPALENHRKKGAPGYEGSQILLGIIKVYKISKTMTKKTLDNRINGRIKHIRKIPEIKRSEAERLQIKTFSYVIEKRGERKSYEEINKMANIDFYDNTPPPSRHLNQARDDSLIETIKGSVKPEKSLAIFIAGAMHVETIRKSSDLNHSTIAFISCYQKTLASIIYKKTLASPKKTAKRKKAKKKRKKTKKNLSTKTFHPGL